MRSGGQGSGVGIREQIPGVSAAASTAERLIVALDVPTLEGAARFVTTLASAVRRLKVGSELFTAVGPPPRPHLPPLGGEDFLHPGVQLVHRPVLPGERVPAPAGAENV